MKINLYAIINLRLEVRRLEEWIRHNIKLGVDNIYLYNNGMTSPCRTKDSKKRKFNSTEKYNEDLSDEEVLKIIDDIKDKYDLVTFVPWIYRENREDIYPDSQISGFKNCISKYCHEESWWLFMDPDEFLFLNKHENLKDFTNDYKEYNHLKWGQVKRWTKLNNYEWSGQKWMIKISKINDIKKFEMPHVHNPTRWEQRKKQFKDPSVIFMNHLGASDTPTEKAFLNIND